MDHRVSQNRFLLTKHLHTTSDCVMYRSLISCVLISFACSEYVDVSTPKGSFRGQKHQFNVEAVEYSADVFYGIPYAKPPVGPLRFQAPQPTEPASEVRKAINKPNACLQFTSDVFRKSYEVTHTFKITDHKIDEDCLYLNVFRPSDLKPNSKLSVMVWIHGGGFVFGSSSLPVYEGRFLAAMKDVIVVSINYRLGPLGFSYLGDETLPGNLGLLDQRLALQWVKENIGSFGGDPDSVTIFGESAGGASVHAQTIAPGSAGLFKRAVIQSGVMTNPWASRSQEEGKQNTLKLAELLGCDVSSNAAVVDCLREKDGIDLVTLGTFNLTISLSKPFPFGPVQNDGDFFTGAPTNNAADVMIGICRNEGSLFTAMFLPAIYSMEESGDGHNIEQFKQTLSTMFGVDWKRIAGAYLQKHLNDNHCATRKSAACDAIEVAIDYLIEESCPAGDDQCVVTTTDLYRDLPMEIFGDEFITCGCLEESRTLHKRGARVYVYEFREYVESTDPEWLRSTHTHEIQYVFGIPLIEPEIYAFKDRPDGTHSEITMDVMEMWTSFAKTGVPKSKPNWPVGPENYMKIEGEGRHGWEKNLKSEMCSFWSQLKKAQQ